MHYFFLVYYSFFLNNDNYSNIIYYRKKTFGTVPKKNEFLDVFEVISFCALESLKINVLKLHNKPVEQWETLPEFVSTKNTIENLSIVNDPAERKVKLFADVDELLTINEE